jgi:hypothetical protein
MVNKKLVVIILMLIIFLAGNSLLPNNTLLAAIESSGVSKGDQDTYQGVVKKMSNLVGLSNNVVALVIELKEFPGKKFSVSVNDAVKFGIIKEVKHTNVGQITDLTGKKVSLTADKKKGFGTNYLGIVDFKLK